VVEGDVPSFSRYRKGMFGKRGETPPLPRNCDARTWKSRNRSFGLGIYLKTKTFG
jgi:hypothetical protein